MNKEEIKKRINELEKKSFFLSMKDSMDSKDFSRYNDMRYEIFKLQKQLEEA